MLSSGYGTGTLTQLDFERHLRSFNLDAEERRRWFTMLDITKDGYVVCIFTIQFLTNLVVLCGFKSLSFFLVGFT